MTQDRSLIQYSILIVSAEGTLFSESFPLEIQLETTDEEVKEHSCDSTENKMSSFCTRIEVLLDQFQSNFGLSFRLDSWSVTYILPSGVLLFSDGSVYLGNRCRKGDVLVINFLADIHVTATQRYHHIELNINGKMIGHPIIIEGLTPIRVHCVHDINFDKSALTKIIRLNFSKDLLTTSRGKNDNCKPY